MDRPSVNDLVSISGIRDDCLSLRCVVCTNCGYTDWTKNRFSIECRRCSNLDVEVVFIGRVHLEGWVIKVNIKLKKNECKVIHRVYFEEKMWYKDVYDEGC